MAISYKLPVQPTNSARIVSLSSSDAVTQIQSDPVQAEFWNNYIKNFLQRPIKGAANSLIDIIKYFNLKGDNDAVIQDVSLSEGMGHAMIFAAERGDWGIFDSLRAGLQCFRKANSLFRWVMMPDGSPITDVRFKTRNPEASASETEQNVAYALLIAYERTKRPEYKKEALTLLDNVWEFEVIDFQGKTLLLPGDITDNEYWPVHKNKEGKIDRMSWSPAYFSPMMYKKFTKYDKAHNWHKLIDDGYSLMNDTLNKAISDKKHFGIIGLNPMPDWIGLTPTNNGGIALESNYPNSDDTFSVDFSNEWDTIRIPIYIGLDKKDSRARNFLERFYDATGIGSAEDVTINDFKGKPINKSSISTKMAIAAFGAGLKCIGRDVSAFTRGLEIGRSNLYYQESITYHAWLMLNNKFPY